MTWAKDSEKDTHRRADGAQVHRLAGDTWAAALPGRGVFPQVIRDARGKHIRKFEGAQAAMAWLDAEHPEKVKERLPC
jgi:hypothetical protein